MKIIQVDDSYIAMLKEQFPSVMDEKRFHRSHSRKYIGVVFQVNDFHYYAPFSSPKNKDYKQDGSIKKNSIFGLYMVKDGKEGMKVLLGTIKLINMIPIPEQFIIEYSIESETDEKYKSIVADEFKWISENQSKITKQAKRLYYFKDNESKMKNSLNAHIYDAILPFKEIEHFLITGNLIVKKRK